MRWKINECMSEIISRSPKETIKEWKAHWEHKDDSDLNFHVKMTVVDQDQETKITQLSFQFDEKNFPAAEVKPLADYSARILDPSLFFKQIEDFWQKHTNRIRIFQEVNLDAQLNRQTGAYRIIFKSKNQALARLQWLISFNDLATEFLETYEVAFTDEGINTKDKESAFHKCASIISNIFPVLGGKLAQECNFPEDIFIKGMYDQWDVKECIKNLQQLVQMHE